MINLIINVSILCGCDLLNRNSTAAYGSFAYQCSLYHEALVIIGFFTAELCSQTVRLFVCDSYIIQYLIEKVKGFFKIFSIIFFSYCFLFFTMIFSSSCSVKTYRLLQKRQFASAPWFSSIIACISSSGMAAIRL